MARKKPTPQNWHKVDGHAGLYTKANGTYAIRFSHKGIRYSFAAGSNLDEAKAQLHDERLKARRGTAGVRDNAYSLARLRDEYIAHQGRRCEPKTTRRYKTALGNILDGLAAERACDLTLAGIEDYIGGRLATASKATVNKELRTLKAMLKFGVSASRIATNPAADVRQLPVKPRDKRFRRALTPAEFENLLDHKHANASPSTNAITYDRDCECSDIWLLLGHTGMRAGELVGMDWDDVDFERGQLHVRGTKTAGSDRRVPMTDRLQAMLERLRDERIAADGEATGPVIRTRTGQRHKWNLWTKLQRCVNAANDQAADAARREAEAAGKRAGRPRTAINPHGVDLYSLRYSFATWLIQAGESPKTVQRLLGHATIAMTLRVYSQVLPGDERRAVEKLNTLGQAGPEQGGQRTADDDDGQMVTPDHHHSITKNSGPQIRTA